LSTNDQLEVKPVAAPELNVTDFLRALATRWRVVVAAPLAAALVALGCSYLVKPTFTARTSFLPPQQPNAAAGTLASLGALAGLAGPTRNSGDQYVAFVQSRTIADRLIERFDLKTAYEEKLAHDARLKLADNTRVSLGRKDGVITLEVDDHDPARAAALASAYLDELKILTANLTLTEAKQRRVFFEDQLKQVRAKLDAAQAALQGTGLSVAAIKAEPKAAVDSLAKMKAELTAAEVRLQVLRSSLAESAPEVRQQLAAVGQLRGEVSRLGQTETSPSGGYVGAYREFKYQEALFDLISRQYEVARVDESRDGGQLQILDAAQLPERKSKPRRSVFMMIGFGLGLLVICLHTAVSLARRSPAIDR